MQELHIDLETYSSVDIKLGVYRYSKSEDFEILLFAYSTDGDPVRVVDLSSGEAVPDEIVEALADPAVTKIAHNAAFERVCLSRWLGVDGFLPPEQWKCTMVWALSCGLPATLKMVGKALGIEKQKFETGTQGIQHFCKPYRGKRKYPNEDPERWAEFKRYNVRDVEAEMEIHSRLKKIATPPPREWQLYWLDQHINDRGIGVDMELVEAVQRMRAEETERLLADAEKIAPGLNIKSNPQMREWLAGKGVEMDSLAKDVVGDWINSAPDCEAKQLLIVRAGAAKTSLKKYDVLQEAQVDGRIRGLFQFNGAGRTGRWSGRMFQPQNIPRPTYEDHENLRPLVKAGDLESVKAAGFDDSMEAFSSVLRTALVPAKGKCFCVADYSAIECRVVAWLADQDWVLQAFADRKDIYCETASKMFGVPVVKHGENGHLRSKGKVATLACGYGGGVRAMLKTGGARMGLTKEEMQEAVDRWREANPRIKGLWARYENAARSAIQKPGTVSLPHGVSFTRHGSCLYVGLPSGRSLIYQSARLDKGKIVFDGLGKSKQWQPIETWGGTLVENVTQAVARDCLAAALLRLEEAGLPVVGHIHDEVIVECDRPEQLEDVERLMGKSLPWAPGLELRAEGFSGSYYRKD